MHVPDSSSSIQTFHNLLQMMTPVHLVKSPPLLRGQGTKYRMVEKPRTRSKSLFGICQSGVHGDQCVVETAQRIIPQSIARCSVFGRLNAGWEFSHSQNVKTAKPLS